MPGPLWDAESDKQLIELWASGLSTDRIGFKMNRSKNSIVGRAHRLPECLPRPSPIRKRSTDQENQPRPPRVKLPPKSPRVTLPAMNAAPIVSEIVSQPIENTVPPEIVEAPVVVVQPEPPPPPPPPLPVKYQRIIDCCWPEGEPRSRSFRYCEKPSLPGKSYCQEHAKMAFSRVRDWKIQDDVTAGRLAAD